MQAYTELGFCCLVNSFYPGNLLLPVFATLPCIGKEFGCLCNIDALVVKVFSFIVISHSYFMTHWDLLGC